MNDLEKKTGSLFDLDFDENGNEIEGERKKQKYNIEESSEKLE